MAIDVNQVFNRDGDVLAEEEVEVPIEEANERSLQRKAEVAIDRMTQIVDADPTQITQRQAIDAIQDAAAAIRALIRLQLRQFDSGD